MFRLLEVCRQPFPVADFGGFYVYNNAPVKRQKDSETMAGMKRSVKMGVVSVVLMGGAVAPSPINAACLVISCVLGLLAAQQGSRWWLAVPGTIIAVSAFILYLGIHGLYD